ncbi:MAG: haloacid dehalogenase, partial [Chloroflexi bacterium]|nr:haloacid dehalogenase [Chloroflexota bacterium]
MSAAAVAEPQILHAVPGRVRIHLPDWSGQGQRALETRLRQLQGVISASANALTSNVLVRFDPAAINTGAILAAVRAVLARGFDEEAEPPKPHVVHEREGQMGRARIAVRGIDRHPQLAQKIREHIGRQPGVRRVTVSSLTGRILVEYSCHETEIEDLVREVAHFELPELIGEDEPKHPLDPRPLFVGATRTIGAALGLGLLAAQRLTGLQPSQGLREGAINSAAVIGLLQSFPFVRNGLRRLFGLEAADLIFYVPGIAVLTLAGSPLGLAVAGGEALRLLTEVIARRAAFRRYEERLETVSAAHPGAVIRLESGEKTPLACSVIEGFGTMVGRHGLPEPVEPGRTIPAGAQIFGGPCVVELQGHSPFTPEPRPAPLAPTLYDGYVRAVGLASLGYAVLTALLTRSLSRTFQAMLLVNTRPGIIGKEAADTGASARALRSGVIVVGTREGRSIRRPDHLLLDGARVLADGYEVTAVIPLEEAADLSDLVALASEIAAAVGSPWGGAFARHQEIGAPGASSREVGVLREATFDGTVASASVDGSRYTLAPVHDRHRVPYNMRTRHQGEHLLVLCRQAETGQEDHPRPLGLFVLRPRIAAGVTELVDTCRRHGVEIGLLDSGHPAAARAFSQRTGIPVLPDGDEIEAVRARQAAGSLVAYVSDSAHAAEVFAACDLAIGVTAGRTGHFPARADLLAPDMHALAAIVEAGARRDVAVRDSVILSSISNVFGAVLGLGGAVGVARASYGVYVAALGTLANAYLRLRGGERPWTAIARLVDPRPERWGRRSVADTLRALRTTEGGLTSAEAAKRRQRERPLTQRNGLLSAILTQIRSPLTGILATGATLSLILGATADVVMIGATIAANVAVGVWQERQAGQAIAALQRIGTSSARVLRDGQPVTIPANEVVPGDVLILAPGDRVAADGRLLSVQGLEVDEAALTGESLPVAKMAEGGTDARRVVLAGSDVTVGTGLAVVVAVGRGTRMGATSAALALDETRTSPL